MLIVQDRKKTELLVVISGFVLITLVIDFFLSNVATEGAWEWLLLHVCFFFIVPSVIIIKVWKRRLSDYYLDFNPSKKGLLSTALVLFFYIAVLLVFVVQLGWSGRLTVSRWVLDSVSFLFFMDLTLVPLVIFSREFFFRGFVMRTALPILGVAGSIMLQAVICVAYDLYLLGIDHWIDAWQQLVLLLLLNIVLGLVAWINKSVLISSVISWVHILAVDLYFIYQMANIQ